MKKVKEYLDEYFSPIGETSCIIKDNGYYKVSGSWEYPENIHDKFIKSNDFMKLSNEERLKYKSPENISIHINNETIIINTIVDGIKNKYGYLQTYEHIPRGEPDVNGYYRRSTDEEIIQYIDKFYQQLKLNQ